MVAVLDGLLVLEWAEGVGGPYCGKLLGDFGATVVKLEVPGRGDPSRSWGPFHDDRPDPNASGLFLHLNTGKRSIELDPTTAEGRELFLRLLRRCDVLVEDRPIAEKASAQLDTGTLRAESPRAIITSVTAFGQDGPYRDYRSDELLLYHLGGFAYVTPNLLEDPENHPPLRSGGMDSEVLGGTFGAVATLLALFGRDRDGRGRRLDVSSYEALASFSRLNLAYMTYEDLLPTRMVAGRPFTGPSGFLPCKDGYVNVHCATDDHWRRFKKVMGDPDWADTDLMATRESRGEFWESFAPLICEWTRNFCRDELYHLFQTSGVCCFPRLDMADIRNYEQLTRRAFFQTVQHPKAGEVVHQGPPFQLPRTPVQLRPAPLLGQHTLEVLREWGGEPPFPALPPTEGKGDEAWTVGPSGPLAGVRILDMTWVIAGPSTCQLMAQMGADVIKIECVNAPDLSRVARPYAERQEGLDRSGYNHSLNAAKRSLNLDISKPAGQKLLDDLVSKCDVMLEGFSWGASKRLGLGYERFVRVNPSLIYISFAGLGRSDPHGNYVTYGPQLMAMGWDSLTGYPGQPPSRQGGGQFTDQFTGANAALAVLLALRHRQKTGEGQYVDLSMLECLLEVDANGLMEYSMTGRVPGHQGNSAPGAAPYNAYRCKGDDRWVAIAVRDDGEWKRFCEATGRPEWLEDPRFANAFERVEHRDELDKLVAGWTIEREADEVMRSLQSVGVPAGRTSRADDLLRDEHLNARGFYAARPHPVVGARKHPDVVFRIDGVRAYNNAPAPLFGEHTDEVLSGVLDLSTEEISRLREEGVLQ